MKCDINVIKMKEYGYLLQRKSKIPINKTTRNSAGSSTTAKRNIVGENNIHDFITLQEISPQSRLKQQNHKSMSENPLMT